MSGHLSRQMLYYFGNSKIHRNPPLQVRKLVCFSKETWSRLKEYFKKGKGGRSARVKKEICPRPIVKTILDSKKIILNQGIDEAPISCYEATDIEQTRDSEYWRWQRLKEYWLYISDPG